MGKRGVPSKRPTEDAFYQEYILDETPVPELAARYGVHKDTIYQWASYYEIKRESKNDSVTCLSLLKEYESTGMRLVDLARKHDMALSTTHRYVAKGREIKAELMKKGMVGCDAVNRIDRSKRRLDWRSGYTVGCCEQRESETD